MEQSKNKVKMAIFSFAILLMGVIGIASGLYEIGKHFEGIKQTSIQLLVTLPCMVIIIVNPIIGKLQEYVSMKTLTIFGILCFLIGGVAPAVLDSFTAILFFRGILGIGIGTVQVLSSALVATHFEGEKRAEVMGQLSSAQMIGCAVMVFASGYLALLGWNMTFYVHLISIISLVCVVLFLPKSKPVKAQGEDIEGTVSQLNGAVFGWAATLFIFFIGALILATYIAFFITDHQLGTAMQAGKATMLFAVGGFLMGLFYGKFSQRARNATLAAGLFMGSAAYLSIAFAPNIFIVYLGSLLYGCGVTTVFASAMIGTSIAVKPAAVPLAMSIVVMGQNLGSFLCPYIVTPIASLMSNDINMFAFITGAILFATMGTLALIWGVARNCRPAVPQQT